MFQDRHLEGGLRWQRGVDDFTGQEVEEAIKVNLKKFDRFIIVNIYFHCSEMI